MSNIVTLKSILLQYDKKADIKSPYAISYILHLVQNFGEPMKSPSVLHKLSICSSIPVISVLQHTHSYKTEPSEHIVFIIW